jgi:hypothetical protein
MCVQDDPRRGPSARLSQACPSSFYLLPRSTGRHDQDVSKRCQLIHFSHRHAQRNQGTSYEFRVPVRYDYYDSFSWSEVLVKKKMLSEQDQQVRV